MHTSLKAVAGATALALLLLFAGGTAHASTRQFPPDTSAPGLPTATTLAPGAVTPTTGVLVPDTTATTASATATTVASGAVTNVEEAPDDSSADPNATKTVWMAIVGLGAVALLILVLTVIYARHTRPDRWHGGQEDWEVPDSPDDLFAPTAARSVFEHKDDEQGFWWAED